MKTHLLNQIMRHGGAVALESDPPAAAAAADPAPQAAPEDQTQMVHVEGPLSTVYSRALDMAYAIQTPQGLTVDNPGQIGTNSVVMESAAMDEMISMSAHASNIERLQNLIQSGDDDKLRIYQTGAATSQDPADANRPEAKSVFTDMIDNYLEPSSEGVKWLFIETVNRPSEDSPIGGSEHTFVRTGGEITTGTNVGAESLGDPQEALARLRARRTGTDVEKTDEIPPAVPEKDQVVPGEQGSTVEAPALGARMNVQETHLTEAQREAYERSRNAATVHNDPQAIPTMLRVPMGTQDDEPVLVNTEPGVYSNFAIESITVIVKTRRVS
jgi:hypothetical protein